MGKKFYLRDTNGSGLWYDASLNVLAWPIDIDLQASGKVGKVEVRMKSHRDGVAFGIVPLNGMEAMYYEHDANGPGQHVYWFGGYLKVKDSEPVPDGLLYDLVVSGPEHEWMTHIPHMQFDEATYPNDAARITQAFTEATTRYGLRGVWDATAAVDSGGFISYPTGSVTPFHRRNLGQILDEIRADPGQPTDTDYPVPVREMYVHAEWVDPNDIPDSGILWVVHYYSPLLVQQEIVPLTDRPDRMADYVSDSFTRANSTTGIGKSDTSQVWANLIGTLGIQSNAAYVVGSATQNATVVFAGVYDGEVEVPFLQNASLQRLAFRVTSHPATAYKWQGFIVQNEGGAGYSLFKYEAGNFDQLGSTFAVTPANNDLIKVVLAGSSIKVYLNGALIITQTSSFNATATLHGLAQQGGSSARWGPFSVRAVAAMHYGLKQKIDSSNAINIQPIAGPGSDPVAVKWANLVGVTGQEDGSLTKTADTLAWDAGAGSTQVFTEDGGWVSTQIEESWKVSDNFDRPDNVAEIGQAGSGQDWEISGSGAVAGIESGKAAFFTVNTEAFDTVDAKVSTGIIQFVLATAVTGAMLIARYADNANMLYVKAEAAAYKLYKRVANVTTQLGTVAITPANGDILKLVCSDQEVKFYHATVGNVPTHQFTVTGVSQGEGNTKWGIGSTNTTARFDDFNVWQTYSDMAAGLTEATGVTTHTAIDYAWRFKADRTAQVSESGSLIAGTDLIYSVGDAFKVEVRPTQVGATVVPTVKYYRFFTTDSDWVEVYQSLVTPTLTEANPLYAGGAIYHKGATLPNVMVRRFTYGVYKDIGDYAPDGGLYGPYPAPEVIYDDTLDTEAKRKSRAMGVFARHRPVETNTCRTNQKYVQGRALLLNVTKLNQTNRRILIPTVKPDWNRKRGEPTYSLTLGTRRREFAEKEPLGYLINGAPDSREGPPVPTGLTAADRDGEQDSPTTVSERISWTQTTGGEQYIWAQIQRVGGGWQSPVRFSAEGHTGTLHFIEPNKPYRIRHQAQGYNGRYSAGWSNAVPFTSASLNLPAAPTTLTFPSEGLESDGGGYFLKVAWPHSTYALRSGYQLSYRPSGSDASIDPIINIPPDQNSVTLHNMSAEVGFDYRIRTLHENGQPGPWLQPSVAHTIAQGAGGDINGSFEIPNPIDPTLPDRWAFTGDATVARDSDYVRHGSWALSISQSGSEAGTATSPRKIVTPGQLVRVKYSIFVSGGQSDLGGHVVFRDGAGSIVTGGNQIMPVVQPSVLETDYVDRVYSYKVPPGGVTAEVNFSYFAPASSPSVTWFDAVDIEYDNTKLDGVTGAVDRSLKAKIDEALSVKDFGAVGDGSTDDTAAVQAAIDAAISSNLGRTLFIPAGDYKLTSTLTIDSVQGIVIRGDGHGATRLTWAGNNSTPLLKVVDTRESTFEGFQIIHGGVGNPLAIGIQQLRSGASVSVVSHGNTYRDIWMDGGAGYLYKCLQFGGSGAYDANNDFNKVEECYFINYRDYGIEVDHSQCYGNKVEKTHLVAYNGAGDAALHITSAGGYISAQDCSTQGHAHCFQNESGSHTSYEPMYLKRINSEGDIRFIEWLGSYGTLRVEDCRYSAGNCVDGDPIITLSGQGHVIIDNCQIGDGAGAKSFWINVASASQTLQFTNNLVTMEPNVSTDYYMPYFWQSGLGPAVEYNNYFINEGTSAQLPMPLYSTTFADGDTTPGIVQHSHYYTANTGATTITNFDFLNLANTTPVGKGKSGEEEIVIHFGDALTTIAHGANIKLAGGRNFTGRVDDVLVLKRLSGYYANSASYWVQVSRPAPSYWETQLWQ